MALINITSDRFDALAHEACRYVFKFMIDEEATFSKDSSLIGLDADKMDLFREVSDFNGGYFTIAVGYVGDAKGLVWLSVPQKLAQAFTVKLLDTPSIEWSGEDAKEMISDTMGELANSFVGLIKGGLTKNFPNLMLTTPNVISNGRLKIDDSVLSFRKQYLFSVLDSSILIDFCHE